MLLKEEKAKNPPRTWARIAEGLVLVLLLSSYVLLLRLYFVPVYNVVDENAYHVSARLFCETQSLRQTPLNGFSFVGDMWVAIEAGDYYSKYPPFYPVLAGFVMKLFGQTAGFYVNPVCAFLAVLGIYVLARALGLGSWSLFAAFMLAGSPVFNTQAIHQMAHPAGMALIVWGYAFYFLAQGRISDTGKTGFFFLAGLFIASATGMRYTNLILTFPPLFMEAANLRRNRLHAPSIALGFGIAIPWATLAIFHWYVYGSPFTTGYSLTGETLGFSIRSFLSNYRHYMAGLLEIALGPTLMLAPLGLLLLIKRNFRAGLFFLLWIAPLLLLYMAYYFSPGKRYVEFLRFVQPALVPLILLAVMFIRHTLANLNGNGGILKIITIALLVLIQGTWGIQGSLEHMENTWFLKKNKQYTVEFIQEHVPTGSIVFAGSMIQNFLDFTGDYQLYPDDLFNRGRLAERIKMRLTNRYLRSWHKRARFVKKHLLDPPPNDYPKRVRNLLSKDLAENREIYIAGTRESVQNVKTTFFPPSTYDTYTSELTINFRRFVLIAPINEWTRLKGERYFNLEFLLLKVIGPREGIRNTDPER